MSVNTIYINNIVHKVVTLTSPFAIPASVKSEFRN